MANRQIFYRYRIIPQIQVNTNNRDTARELFGHKVSAPIDFAPIGINHIYYLQGELAIAKVAKELNLVYYLASTRSYSIEDIAKENDQGPRFL